MPVYRVVARQVKYQDHIIAAENAEEARQIVEHTIGTNVQHEEITEWEVVNVEPIAGEETIQ